VSMGNTNLSDLIAFAYGLDPKQIIGAPAGSDDHPYDIDGVADVDGMPDVKQMQLMFQQLLASRFKIAFHLEQKRLSVYALRMAKGGTRLIRTTAAASDYTEFRSNAGELRITNKSMAEIADVMKYFVDRPVVDQTSLTGRFDFVLKWTPDDAQGSDPNAPPGLFTAIQEQLGLKLEPVKAPVEVQVIDHVERPTEN
ncbi:MAG: TIGR03435 family protein, partial [Terracidiphilus sp.]